MARLPDNYTLEGISNHPNIAELLDETERNDIGAHLKKAVDIDVMSRQSWEEDNDKWLELSKQYSTHKNKPWSNASNVKYPILNIASIHFHARAFPALIHGKDLVDVRKVGDGENVQTKQRALRVSKFMSTQIVDLMPNWLDDFDKLLMMLPITGLAYRKVYFDNETNMVRSDLVHPRDVIVNYHADNLLKARVTHRLWKTPNEIKEMQNQGIYLDIDLGTPIHKEKSKVRDTTQGIQNPGPVDDYTPYEIFEVHCLLDLDDDGYQEPYIVTIHDNNVLRIVSRWDAQYGVVRNQTGDLLKIRPETYFVRYSFIPDTESDIYATGFGRLLGPLNAATNTLINQLIDSGTLSNLPSGFVGRGFRPTNKGMLRMQPGRWENVQYAGDDIRKSIFPIPVKEPSTVLFQLLGLLVDSARDVSSVQDIMQGKNPGQNQPHATSAQVLEQGLKIFNGIYKRIHRALSEEFQLIYKLNRDNISPEIYSSVTGMDNNPQMDFAYDDLKIIPSAEADMVQESKKLLKAEMLMTKLVNAVPLNRNEVIRRVLEAEGHNDVQTLMDAAPPQPNPELQLKQAELQHKQQVDFANLELTAMKTQEQALRDRTAAYKQLVDAMVAKGELDLDFLKAELENIDNQQKNFIAELEAETKRIVAMKPQPKPAKKSE